MVSSEEKRVKKLKDKIKQLKKGLKEKRKKKKAPKKKQTKPQQTQKQIQKVFIGGGVAQPQRAPAMISQQIPSGDTELVRNLLLRQNNILLRENKSKNPDVQYYSRTDNYGLVGEEKFGPSPAINISDESVPLEDFEIEEIPEEFRDSERESDIPNTRNIPNTTDIPRRPKNIRTQKAGESDEAYDLRVRDRIQEQREWDRQYAP